MSNQKKFSAKGYYIALVLCAAAIGVSGYLYYSNGSEKTADVPAAVTQQELQEAGAPNPTAPKATTAPTEPAATMPKEPLKTAAPVEGEAVAEYAMDCLAYNATTRDWRVHGGLDLAAEAGTKVCAAADGTVYTVYEDETMGMTVVIRHDGGYTTTYSSLAQDLQVSAGDTVKLGQVLGCVGSTALIETASGPHVHFSVTYRDEQMDPAEFLALGQ